MKFRLLLTAIVLFTVSAFAQEVKKEAAPDQAMEAKSPGENPEMAAWMAYMTPGDMHKMMASAVGDWTQEVTMWMDPAAPPSKSVADCTVKMLFGDRYQESYTNGDMMGMPFEGKSTMAYDNIRKVFQSTWIDNMGTGLMYTEGPYDAKSNSITLTGTMVDPMSGKTEKVKEVMKFIDDNNQMMYMYILKDGKEIKTMEIKFTRK